jgi:hypothetical protein
MRKIIEIIVTPDGKSRVETKGFSGSECRQASQFVEQALGQQVNEVLTQEFYASSAEQQPAREGQ